MRRRLRALTVVLAGLFAGLSVGCARRGEPVATLVESQGTVERNDGAQGWAIAGHGFAFVVGDVLRTGAGARARSG